MLTCTCLTLLLLILTVVLTIKHVESYETTVEEVEVMYAEPSLIPALMPVLMPPSKAASTTTCKHGCPGLV